MKRYFSGRGDELRQVALLGIREVVGGLGRAVHGIMSPRPLRDLRGFGWCERQFRRRLAQPPVLGDERNPKPQGYAEIPRIVGGNPKAIRKLERFGMRKRL